MLNRAVVPILLSCAACAHTSLGVDEVFSGAPSLDVLGVNVATANAEDEDAGLFSPR